MGLGARKVSADSRSLAAHRRRIAREEAAAQAAAASGGLNRSRGKGIGKGGRAGGRSSGVIPALRPLPQPVLRQPPPHPSNNESMGCGGIMVANGGEDIIPTTRGGTSTGGSDIMVANAGEDVIPTTRGGTSMGGSDVMVANGGGDIIPTAHAGTSMGGSDIMVDGGEDAIPTAPAGTSMGSMGASDVMVADGGEDIMRDQGFATPPRHSRSGGNLSPPRRSPPDRIRNRAFVSMPPPREIRVAKNCHVPFNWRLPGDFWVSASGKWLYWPGATEQSSGIGPARMMGGQTREEYFRANFNLPD